MAKRSHVKIAGTDYSGDMILKRQLIVQCYAENTELIHERCISACDCDASRSVEFGGLLSGTSYDCLRFVWVEE